MNPAQQYQPILHPAQLPVVFNQDCVIELIAMTQTMSGFWNLGLKEGKDEEDEDE